MAPDIGHSSASTFAHLNASTTFRMRDTSTGTNAATLEDMVEMPGGISGVVDAVLVQGTP